MIKYCSIPVHSHEYKKEQWQTTEWQYAQSQHADASSSGWRAAGSSWNVASSPASSYGGSDSPDDASAELIAGSGKGVPADTSQGAQGQDEAEEEDSGRGSASTALAVNFRPRYVTAER